MRIFIAILVLGFCWACSSDQVQNTTDQQHNKPVLISSSGQNASGAFFTQDHKDRQVLVWTEKLPGEENTGNVIKFARWNADQHTFEAPVEVASSKGCRSHDESMSKVAFKQDGTIVAVFSKRTPTKENRFAGALYYTQSFDQGNQWTDARFLHVGDTTHGLSRSFFDLATLPDGEVAAIWLDSRLTKKRGDGSSLFFSKTQGREGFTKDQAIGTGTCECCRTELFVAANGDIHALYRDIWQDSIRDISIVTSTNNGLSFSTPQKLSPDNWAVNGCPHTGPSFSETKDELHCTWFTMGGGSGIYYTASQDNGKRFAPRKLLTTQGRHPQLLALQNDELVFVWDENTAAAHSHHAGHQHEEAQPAGRSTSYIKAQVWVDGNPVREHWVSMPEAYAEFPVVAEMEDNKIGIAWVQDIGESDYGIYFRVIESI